jgi:anti-sigma regulatory factor (Ser/Thr protein kinase)
MSLVDSESLAEAYPSVAESVPAARERLTDFAVLSGADREQVEAVRLATSEALTNAVVHAYRRHPGQLHVAAWIAGSELWVLIGGDGNGLKPNADSPGLGVGLALIAQVTDGLAIVKRSSGGTEVRMRFDLGVADLEDGDHSSESSSRSASRPASSRFSTTR